MFTHSSRRVSLYHCLNAGIFERALGQLRLSAAAARFHDNKFAMLNGGIICRDSIPHVPTGFLFDQLPTYNSSMPDHNPLAGVVPRVVHRADRDETTISQQIDKIEGEVELDSYVKAQTSAPEVVKRITELENSLQRLANAVFASSTADSHPELRAAAEEAKLVLKNRVEVDNTKHPIHTELGVFKDELRLIKD